MKKNENSKKRYILAGSPHSDFSGYVFCDNREKALGRWMIFNKTIRDVYKDIWNDAKKVVGSNQDDIFDYIGIINILNANNYGKRMIYDYASTPDNDIIDNLEPHLMVVREHVVDIWVNFGEYSITRVADGCLVTPDFKKYIQKYSEPREDCEYYEEG